MSEKIAWPAVLGRHGLMALFQLVGSTFGSGGIRRQRYRSRSAQRLPAPCEHREVGVMPHARNPANAQVYESVVHLQATELELDGGAATVEALPLVQTFLVTASVVKRPQVLIPKWV